ncbi:MAG: ATP-binding cassette domain-containing protein [Bacteroidales bacterium]|nr:ATP-binding cassette domain-containing protein [Bacteroidales bacterium]MCL2738745.1 ATP-binding cassette domain-containing protein [Bacteroidales bacterium]
MEVLAADSIVKRFSNHTALDNVSIRVRQGTVFGLLGPNGAGKTTLIRIINQITAPDSGSVSFMGRDLQADDIYQIGYLPEERGLYKKMKVGEQALYLAQLKGVPRQQAMKELKAWFVKFGIQAWWDKKIEELSKGMAQKVQFITTVLHKPQLLILDEPFSGFDPVNVQLIRDEILQMKANGCSIILSTHNMESVEELCDNIALINKSKVILDGAVDDVRLRYGDNRIEMTYRASTALSPSTDLPKAQILSQKEEKNGYSMVIDLRPEGSMNQILAALLPQVDILSVHQLIPRMNEIFIKLVTAKS